MTGFISLKCIVSLINIIFKTLTICLHFKLLNFKHFKQAVLNTYTEVVIVC